MNGHGAPRHPAPRYPLPKCRAWICGFAALALMGGCSPRSTEPVPPGYPVSYGAIVAAAEKEGGVVVWSSVDHDKAARLLADFRAMYPLVRLTYKELPAQELDRQFHAAADHHRQSADILWSSAMDLQIKLVNDGYSARYTSPEKPAVPDWANWKDEAWGITAEPIVMIYNRRLLPDAQAPRDHAQLTAMLEAKPARLDGRIASYDVTRSAVGYLYFTQDRQASPAIWQLIRAMGANHLRGFATAEEILRDVAAGHALVGYNIIGSYALEESLHHPDIGVILPSDYTLIMSRIVMIPKAAAHPNGARLFLDYLLSPRGQRQIKAMGMAPVRADVAPPAGLNTAGRPTLAIEVGPPLLAGQDRLTHDLLIKRWQRTLAGP